MPNKRKRTRAGANRRARPHGRPRHDGPAAAGTEAGITPGTGTLAALDGWNQPCLIAALDENGTTWIHGAADPRAAEQTAAQLPGTRVTANPGQAGEPGPAVIRTRILTPAEAGQVRTLITQQQRQQQQERPGPGHGPRHGQEPGPG